MLRYGLELWLSLFRRAVRLWNHRCFRSGGRALRLALPHVQVVEELLHRHAGLHLFLRPLDSPSLERMEAPQQVEAVALPKRHHWWHGSHRPPRSSRLRRHRPKTQLVLDSPESRAMPLESDNMSHQCQINVVLRIGIRCGLGRLHRLLGQLLGGSTTVAEVSGAL